jgi:hypothetical protein
MCFRITGLQVRAMPDAKRIPEPIGGRSSLTQESVTKLKTYHSLTTFQVYPSLFSGPSPPYEFRPLGRRV